MRYSLRDEILVVMRYENKKSPSGLCLMQRIEMFRDNVGDPRKVLLTDMSAELKAMVNHGLLDPWQYLMRSKRVRKIENVDKFHLITETYYTLTYSGYQEHLRVVEKFVMNRMDFRLYLRNKPGQS